MKVDDDAVSGLIAGNVAKGKKKKHPERVEATGVRVLGEEQKRPLAIDAIESGKDVASEKKTRERVMRKSSNGPE